LPTLNREFALQTQRLLNGFSLAVGVLVLSGVALGAWLDARQGLELASEILANRLEAQVEALVHEVDAIAASALLEAQLESPSGPNGAPSTTLDAWFAALNRTPHRRYRLFDQSGASRLPKGPAGEIPRHAVLEVLQGGKPIQLLLDPGPLGATLTVLQPIFSRSAMRPVGVFAAQLSPLLPLHTNPGASAQTPLNTLAGTDEVNLELQPTTPSSWGSVRVSRAIKQLTTASGSPVRVGIERSILRIALAPLGVLTVLAFCLLALQVRIRSWANQASARMTERLDQLSDVCLRIAAGEPVLPDPDPTTDEIGILTRVLRAAMQAQVQLTEQLEPAAMVLRNVQEGVVVTDDGGRITQVNPAFLRMTGWQAETLIGQPGGVIYRSSDNRRQAAEIAQAVRCTGQWRGETKILRADDSNLPVLLSIAAVHDSTGVRRGNVALLADISEARKTSDRLRKMALTDPLTGLSNHAGFEPELHAALLACVTHPSGANQARVALAFIDLDRLKFLNDLFGHRVGDEAIRLVARHLKAAMPAGAMVSRRSGDEFLLFVPFNGSLEPIRTLFEHLLDDLILEDPQLPGGRLTLSLSLGAAICPEHASTTADLMVAADSALREAKVRGRGQVAWYDINIGRQLQARLHLENQLRTALERNDISVAYQPEIDLNSGQILGFEALARWKNAPMGEVSPADFIPVAEDAKLIDEVFDAVLQRVLVDLPRIAERFRDARVAINVSPRQLRDDRLVQLLTKHRLKMPNLGDLLDLEITETDLAGEESRISAPLLALAALGMRIVIDDFGKGHSSLARLTSLPISRLKIDRGFVAGLEHSSQGAIVRAILGLAEAAGLAVTAEGIEQTRQLDTLRNLGCSRGQGWLFSRALPIEAALRLPRCLDLARSGQTILLGLAPATGACAAPLKDSKPCILAIPC